MLLKDKSKIFRFDKLFISGETESISQFTNLKTFKLSFNAVITNQSVNFSFSKRNED